jgi:Family of unknown function (DUF5808)
MTPDEVKHLTPQQAREKFKKGLHGPFQPFSASHSVPSSRTSGPGGFDGSPRCQRRFGRRPPGSIRLGLITTTGDFNRKDDRVIVPKRRGLGSTFNFAGPPHG